MPEKPSYEELERRICAMEQVESEWRQTESSLKELKRSYERLTDYADEAIFKVKAEGGHVLYLNPTAERIFGYSKEEWLSDPDLGLKIIHPEYREEQIQIVNKINASKKPIKHVELGWLTKQGRKVILEYTIIPILDKNGNIEFFESIGHDITERKQAEEKIRFQSKLLESVGQSVIAAGVDRQMTYWNKAAENLFGWSLKEITEKDPIRQIIVPEDENQAKKIIRSVYSGKKWSGEFQIKRKDGHILPAFHTITPVFDEKEQLKGIIVVSADLTQQKKMEAQIRNAQKMESIGSLAAGIAHDFNNILFPIIGISEMLLEDLSPETILYENAQEILKAGKRGSDLVKQILAFSRQSEHKLIPVHIQQVLKEVLKLIRSTIPSNIEIHEDIQPDCGLTMADPVQIHQIAMNMITNAFHAVEDNRGKISITLKEKMLTCPDLKDTMLEQGKYLVLSVSDTGYGIPKEIVDKIFDPYFTTKEKGKGTGLGLSVVYGIVREHKGEIKVCSEPGKGSTFTVYLPLMNVQKAEKPVIPREVYQTGNERILLVDDEASVVNIQKQLLERLGYRITSRLHSVEALEAFKAAPYSFDMVITDMTMPDLTGSQLAERILAIRSNIPIVICTGFSERIDEEKARETGIKGFLMKPVVRAELAKKVRNILDEYK